ncbi:MAG: hypothetical protein P1U56_12725 [Saprospiraceae bacterium]|nr:hypothetical protein [Saprospiraceae bacterium]
MDKLQIILFAQNFVNEFDKLGIDLDYSVQSLENVESYISKTIMSSKPKTKSYFNEDTETKAVELGAYLGEVIRRNSKAVRWKNADVESPLEVALESADGSVFFVINKAYKRIKNGEEDNIFYFARVILKELQKSEKAIPTDFFDEEDLRINTYGNSPLTIYSTAIDNYGGIVYNIYFENGLWYFSSSEENERHSISLDSPYLFLEEVKLKHPEFASLLHSKNKLRIIRLENGTYRAQKEHKSLLYDSHTIPEYQGDMQLNIFRWIRFNFKHVMKSLSFLIISGVLMIKIHWVFAFVFIGSLLYNIWYWIHTFNRFKGGDVNLGKVISLRPTLVAVASDMRKYSGDYPILKIVETKLPKTDMELDKIIPTIALYNDNPHGYPFWAEFHPVPVSQGIGDRNHIDQMLSNFSQSKIDTLNDYIEKTKTYQTGIYKVDEETSNWANYKHIDLSKGINMEKPFE